jgi:glycosyltransferase involved in cell wall biosynthesis
MAPATPSLTVVILTLNEEKNLPGCLESVKAADELLVVDSGSADGTVAVAEAARARVVSHPMKDFAEQHNFAASQATSEWVLHLDADERLTPELWAEIQRAIGSEEHAGYLIPTLNVVFGAPLRHGGWYPQHHLRLYRRGAGSWTGNVHETVTLAAGSVGRLHEPFLHLGHPDIHTFLVKLDRYTTMEAARATGSRLRLALLAAAVPAPYFLYKYVVQGGFRDGWRGLAAALLLSFYRCVTFLKAVEQR